MSNDEKLKRDKLLLDLMIHAYDEDVARNELVDSKNCQMIILTGAMLTLQATLFINVLIENILLNYQVLLMFKILSSMTMIISIVLYLYSMYIFIDAYNFLSNKFYLCPEPQYLLDKAINNQNEFDAQGEILATMCDTINENYSLIESKVNKGKVGFIWLKRAVFSTLVIIILFLLILI